MNNFFFLESFSPLEKETPSSVSRGCRAGARCHAGAVASRRQARHNRMYAGRAPCKQHKLGFPLGNHSI